MTNEDLKTKGPSQTHITEEQSRHILRGKLPMAEALIEDYEVTYPNIDGHIEFIKSDGGSTSVRLHFQLKSTDQPNLASYPCTKEFLNYCYQSHEPIALIFVNIPQGKVYWRLINQAYIVSTLDIPDLAVFDQETKTVTFSDDQMIDNNTPTLLDACEKHYADTSRSEQYARGAREKMQLVSGQEVAVESLEKALTDEQAAKVDDMQQAKELEKRSAQKTFAELEDSFLERVRNLPEKMMLYHTFVHALRPFYLDYRSQAKRVKLLEFLGITEAEERYIIENLTKANLLGRAGDLIFVTNREDAVLSLDHFFEAGIVDPEKVAELFSDEKDQ